MLKPNQVEKTSLNPTVNNEQAEPAVDPALIPMPQQDMANGRELTTLQKVAEKTHGIITPANAITALGITLTALGCHEFVTGSQMAAIGTIAVGACCDALDGLVARKTRTANYPAGRWFDIGADGIKAGMLGYALYESGIYSGVELGLNYGPKVAGWVANGISKFVAKNEPKTSQTGRVAEVSRWIGPGLSVASSLLTKNGYAALGEVAKNASYVGTLGAFALGSVAALGYCKDLILSKVNKSNSRAKTN